MILGLLVWNSEAQAEEAASSWSLSDFSAGEQLDHFKDWVGATANDLGNAVMGETGAIILDTVASTATDFFLDPLRLGEAAGDVVGRMDAGEDVSGWDIGVAVVSEVGRAASGGQFLNKVAKNVRSSSIRTETQRLENVGRQSQVAPSADDLNRMKVRDAQGNIVKDAQGNDKIAAGAFFHEDDLIRTRPGLNPVAEGNVLAHEATHLENKEWYLKQVWDWAGGDKAFMDKWSKAWTESPTLRFVDELLAHRNQMLHGDARGLKGDVMSYADIAEILMNNYPEVSKPLATAMYYGLKGLELAEQLAPLAGIEETETSPVVLGAANPTPAFSDAPLTGTVNADFSPLELPSPSEVPAELGAVSDEDVLRAVLQILEGTETGPPGTTVADSSGSDPNPPVDGREEPLSGSGPVSSASTPAQGGDSGGRTSSSSSSSALAEHLRSHLAHKPSSSSGPEAEQYAARTAELRSSLQQAFETAAARAPAQSNSNGLVSRMQSVFQNAESVRGAAAVAAPRTGRIGGIADRMQAGLPTRAASGLGTGPAGGIANRTQGGLQTRAVSEMAAARSPASPVANAAASLSTNRVQAVLQNRQANSNIGASLTNRPAAKATEVARPLSNLRNANPVQGNAAPRLMNNANPIRQQAAQRPAAAPQRNIGNNIGGGGSRGRVGGRR